MSSKIVIILYMEAFKNGSSGRLRIGLLLFLALIGASLYLGFQLAPYWINAAELKEFMNEKVRTTELAPDENIRAAIIAKADQLGIALTDRDIEIDRSPPTITMTATWQFDYNFFGVYTRTFTFSPHVTFNRR